MSDLFDPPARVDAHLVPDPTACPDCHAEACVHDLHCLGCCVRLVASARPDKRKANAMLSAIGRVEGAPARAEILSRLGAM